MPRLVSSSIDVQQFDSDDEEALSPVEWSAEKHAPFVDVLAKLLESWVAQTDRKGAAVPSQQCAVFFSSKPAPISVEAYVTRLARYSKCSTSCLLIAYVYIERIVQDHGVPVCSATVHRLLATAVVLAAKFVDDRYYTNKHYAKVGGITLADLNRMELEMLLLLRYRLYVSVGDMKVHLRQAMAGCFETGRPKEVNARKRRSMGTADGWVSGGPMSPMSTSTVDTDAFSWRRSTRDVDSDAPSTKRVPLEALPATAGDGNPSRRSSAISLAAPPPPGAPPPDGAAELADAAPAVPELPKQPDASPRSQSARGSVPSVQFDIPSTSSLQDYSMDRLSGVLHPMMSTILTSPAPRQSRPEAGGSQRLAAPSKPTYLAVQAHTQLVGGPSPGRASARFAQLAHAEFASAAKSPFDASPPRGQAYVSEPCVAEAAGRGQGDGCEWPGADDDEAYDDAASVVHERRVSVVASRASNHVWEEACVVVEPCESSVAVSDDDLSSSSPRETDAGYESKSCNRYPFVGDLFARRAKSLPPDFRYRTARLTDKLPLAGGQGRTLSRPIKGISSRSRPRRNTDMQLAVSWAGNTLDRSYE